MEGIASTSGQAPLEALQVAINLWSVPYPSSLKLRPWRPDGAADARIELDTFDATTNRPIKGGGMGVNVIKQCPVYGMSEQGTYWFDVLFEREGQEDRLLTRIPLEVRRVGLAN
jgi:hypothetical protein